MAQQQDLHLFGRCSHATSGATDHVEPNRQPDTGPSITPDSPAFPIEPDTVANTVADTVAFHFEPDIIALYAAPDTGANTDIGTDHHPAYRAGRDGFSNAESDIGAVPTSTGTSKHTVYPWR